MDSHTTAACGAWWGVLLLFGLIGWVNHRTARRAARPPRGPVPVEVLRPTPPARPVCLHRNAVKVNSGVPGLDLTWCCWCPDCETVLPANWTRFCCGTQPETPTRTTARTSQRRPRTRPRPSSAGQEGNDD